MVTPIIHIPDRLYRRAEEIALLRGETVDELVRELLEEYLEELNDIQDAVEDSEASESTISFEDYVAQRDKRRPDPPEE